MSYGFYRVLHYLSGMAVLMSLGSILLHAALSDDKRSNPWRRPLVIFHGVGLLLLLVSGFGLLAKLNLAFPVWAVGKVVLWLALGAMLSLAYKFRSRAFVLWLITLLCGLLAAYLGGQKPAF